MVFVMLDGSFLDLMGRLFALLVTKGQYRGYET